MKSAFGLKCPLKTAADYFLVIINTKLVVCTSGAGKFQVQTSWDDKRDRNQIYCWATICRIWVLVV